MSTAKKTVTSMGTQIERNTCNPKFEAIIYNTLSVQPNIWYIFTGIPIFITSLLFSDF